MEYNIAKMEGDKTTYRYILASKCTKPLVVIGVNPSTANEEAPDRTIRKVMGFVQNSNEEGIGKYDGFVMLNLYAQRSTLFKGVDTEKNEVLHQGNLQAIRAHFEGHDELDVLVAFGNLVMQRPFLLDCFCDIVSVLEEKGRKIHWKQIGELTKKYNPRHPLYAPYNYGLLPFDKVTFFARKKK